MWFMLRRDLSSAAQFYWLKTQWSQHRLLCQEHGGFELIVSKVQPRPQG
jgi:hypothetical protein